MLSPTPYTVTTTFMLGLDQCTTTCSCARFCWVRGSVGLVRTRPANEEEEEGEGTTGQGPRDGALRTAMLYNYHTCPSLEASQKVAAAVFIPAPFWSAARRGWG